MGKFEDIVRLCIEVNTTDELEYMLSEECWTEGAKWIFRDEIQRRRGVHERKDQSVLYGR